MPDGEPSTGRGSSPRPAHRPSRREEIVDAAIRVFDRAGYAAASVEDIAQECGVAATAIYYHFGGKEELFNQALRTALDRLSEAAYAARMSGGDTPLETLRAVIRAGWARTITDPAETRFLLHHTFRPTPEARKLQQDWEERHVQRTFDYLPQPAVPPRTPREARQRHAARLLASRVITYTIIVAQESRLDAGPLSELPVPQIATAVEDVCVRVVAATGTDAPARRASPRSAAQASTEPQPPESQPSTEAQPPTETAPPAESRSSSKVESPPEA